MLFFLISQVVLSLKSELLSQLLAKDPLRTALWQLSSCLENYFLGGDGEVALALSIQLYYQIVPTFALVRSDS